MDLPNLDQDSPYYEAVESIISSIDSRLFVIFPSLFCPIFYYDWPFRESLFFLAFFSYCFWFTFPSLYLFFCFWVLLMVSLFVFFIYSSAISLSLSLSVLNILLYSLFLPFLPLVSFLLLFVTSFFLKLLGEFQFVPFRLKTADLLFLGRDDAIRSVISDLSVMDERIRVLKFVLFRRALQRFLYTRTLELDIPYSRASVIGGIKFNLSDFGELQTACRLWKDYCAKRGAVVYVVNADTEWNIREAREDLNNLLHDENFEMVPFLILCKTADPSASEEELCILVEERLCNLLGLTNMRTGRGRVDLAGRNVRPLEVFVVEQSNRRHLDAIMWLSQYFE